MIRRAGLFGVLLIWSAMLGAAARAQLVQGDVRAVGFRTPSQAGFLIRTGQWIPILVELSTPGKEHFQGGLRCEQPDLDGDPVAFTESPVVLTAGGGLKRVWCYAVSQALPFGVDTGPRKLALLDERGTTVAEFDVPEAELLPAEALLVLDVSVRPVVALRSLVHTDDPQSAPRWYRPLVVSQMAANELPDRWIGLEAVRVVVWDDPNIDAVSPAQLDALVEWVRAGGQLVLGLGASWAGVSRSRLGPLLPVRGAEVGAPLEALPEFARRFGGGAEQATLDKPIAVAPVRRATGLLTLWEGAPGQPATHMIVMGAYGAGRVTVVAATLRDLCTVLRSPEEYRRFLGELLDLNQMTERQWNSAQEQFNLLERPRRELYRGVVQPIEFQQFGGLLATAATGFALAYALLATVASWWWLKRQNLTHLSWTVFAVFAVAASALSLGMVGVTRGFSRLLSMSVVDLDAGQSDAQAACWFGYRSPIRQALNLSLPRRTADGKLATAGNYLRGLSGGPQARSVYATVERYSAQPDRATLTGTPLRATVKQFEGFWRGELRGTIRGQVRVGKDNGRVRPDSWIRNDLDVSIRGGWLLYIDPRIADPRAGRDVPHRAAGLYRDWRNEPREVPPSLNVIAVDIPPIGAGEQVRNLGSAVYTELDLALARWQAKPAANRGRPPELQSLFDLHQVWVGNTQSLLSVAAGQRADPLDDACLAATLALYSPCAPADFDTYHTGASIMGLVDRDVSHWLAQGQALLLLKSDEPGPATLYADGEPLGTPRGSTLYRVRIPVEYDGVRPTPGASQ